MKDMGLEGVREQRRHHEPGTVVRPQHYATFHWALEQLTGIDWALGPPVPVTAPPGAKTTPVPPEWRRQSQRLDAEQVSKLTAVVEARFFDLAPEYRPPGAVSDGFVVRWRACVDDRAHTVTLHAVDPGEIDGLAQVRDAFELALGEAAAAEADPEPGD